MNGSSRFPLIEFLRRSEHERNNVKLMLQAGQYFSAGDFTRAAESCEKILGPAPKDVHALFLAGLCCRELRRHADAVRYFDRLMALDQAHENGCALLYRGLSHKALGHSTEARADFEAAQNVSTLTSVRAAARHELAG